jgi:hypothetical protein
MKLKWIRGIAGMLITIFGSESLQSGALKEEETPKEPSKNPHSEETTPRYPKEINNETAAYTTASPTIIVRNFDSDDEPEKNNSEDVET